MPDAYGFDHLPDGADIELRCIEPNCEFGGRVWEVSEEIRHEHYLTHYREAMTVSNDTGSVYEVQGDIRVQGCRDCGAEFSQPRRRGRPRLTCDTCAGREASDG